MEGIGREAELVSGDGLAAQDAAFSGTRGGLLIVVNTETGTTLKTIKLPAPPAWDAMAAAYGRLYVATTDGRIVCLGGE